MCGRLRCRCAGDYVEADGDGEADGDADSDGDTQSVAVGEGDGDAESVGDGDGDAQSDGVGDGDGDGESDSDGDGESDGVGDADGESDGAGVGESDTESVGVGVGDAAAGLDGDGEADGGSRNTDADGEGDADGDSGGCDDCFGVTVQRKLTEPVAPDEDVAVTVTSYVPAAVDEMVPVISPLLLIDKPGGRFDAANCGDCPSAALSEVTCSWIADPTAFCWLLGSSRRTAAWRK
jgi:hypothetical protein